MATFPQITSPPQLSAEVIVNDAHETIEHVAVYGKRQATTTGLDWGYYGGRWGGILVTAGVLALTDNAINYYVVEIATSTPTVSTSATNWNNLADYSRVYKLTTLSGAVTVVEDHREGPGGVGYGGGSVGSSQVIAIACSDEITPLTTGAAKVTFRMPYAFTLAEVRASLTEAQPSGSIFTVDINESGASLLSTKVTIDNTEKTSKTAATPPVISDTALADDAEITIDIDQVGASGAKGLKVYLIGTA